MPDYCCPFLFYFSCFYSNYYFFDFSLDFDCFDSFVVFLDLLLRDQNHRASYLVELASYDAYPQRLALGLDSLLVQMELVQAELVHLLLP